jgi:bifunctional non-homologous end joining protein LigD
MKLHIGSEIPEGSDWVFEPKYDGVRVLAFVERGSVRLVTRNGRDKARQFPEVVEALRALATRVRQSFVLDGEVVALARGKAARFQALQTRIHLDDAPSIAEEVKRAPAALIVFDLLVDGSDELLGEPWSTRRERLERLLRGGTSTQLQLSEFTTGNAPTMLRRARAKGWEGVIAKRKDSLYRPGKRSHEWLKLKIEFRQELVVGGWTEPRRTRKYLGALLLGYYEGGRLVFAGGVGTGFDRDSLRDMYERLTRLERKTSPFADPPKTREPVHWVRPVVVVEVKFSEWTNDGKLRQPVFVGVRDDKSAREVGREPKSFQESRFGRSPTSGSTSVSRQRHGGTTP